MKLVKINQNLVVDIDKVSLIYRDSSVIKIVCDGNTVDIDLRTKNRSLDWYKLLLEALELKEDYNE